MKRYIIHGKNILLYDSIDELPIINFQKYNKFLLIDTGIGSDADSIDKHISRIARYIKDDVPMALKELQNMRQNMFMITNEISPKNMAFAALIHSIDGKKVEDLTDENLKSILEELNFIPHGLLYKIVEGVKKKIQEELELYFPKDFVRANEKENYDKLKRRTLLVLDGIITGYTHKAEIEEIDDYFFKQSKPITFSGSESAEIAYDKQFETMCTLIAQKVGLDAKKMTVLQFYNTIFTIKQQMEAESKMYKKHKK